MTETEQPKGLHGHAQMVAYLEQTLKQVVAANQSV